MCVAVCRVPAGFSRRPAVGYADLHDRGTDRRPGGFERTPPILSGTSVSLSSVEPTARPPPLHGRLYTGLSAPTCAPANVRAPHSSHPPPSYSSQATSAAVVRPNSDDVRASKPCNARKPSQSRHTPTHTTTYFQAPEFIKGRAWPLLGSSRNLKARAGKEILRGRDVPGLVERTIR